MSTDHPTHRPPAVLPVARHAAVVIGLTLLVVALVCAREIWLRHSRSLTWESWVEPVIQTVGDATFQPWMVPAGVGALLLGCLLVWMALRPRRHRHESVPGAVPVWMRPVDIARAFTSAARTVPGVATASTHVGPRTVTVTVSGMREDLPQLVEQACADLPGLLGLDRELRVRQLPTEEAP